MLSSFAIADGLDEATCFLHVHCVDDGVGSRKLEGGLAGRSTLKMIFAAICAALVNVAATAQTESSAPPDAIPAATPSVDGMPVVLKKDTPVELMSFSEVSTADSTPGKRFKLILNKPIIIDGKVVAPKGSVAFGEVTSAEESGSLGKSGRMTAKILFLRLGDVDIPLEGQTTTKGTGAGSAGVAVLFTGWVGLFHRGNNAKIKAGELMTAFIAEDVALDLTTVPTKRAVLPAAASQLQ